jgi:hypothetical protein
MEVRKNEVGDHCGCLCRPCNICASRAWTCSPNGTPTSVLFRFTVSPPDVIFTLREDMRLSIVNNDDYGLVATGSATMTQLMSASSA